MGQLNFSTEEINEILAAPYERPFLESGLTGGGHYNIDNTKKAYIIQAAPATTGTIRLLGATGGGTALTTTDKGFYLTILNSNLLTGKVRVQWGGLTDFWEVSPRSELTVIWNGSTWQASQEVTQIAGATVGAESERPAHVANKIQFHKNTTSGAWEYSDGATWANLTTALANNVQIAQDGDTLQDKIDNLSFGQCLLVGPNPSTAYAGFNFSAAINNITVQGLTNWNGSSYPAVISGNVSITGTGIRFRLQNLQIDGTFTIGNGGSNWITECYFGSTCDFSATTGFTQVYRTTFAGAVTGSFLSLFVECSTPLVANLPTLALAGSFIFVNETNTWHFWKGAGWEDSGANNWPDAVSKLKFVKYEVTTANSPFTVPSWNCLLRITNDTAPIEIILPTATAADLGSEVKFWFQNNTANNKVTIKAPSTGYEINGIDSDGTDVAKAEFSSNKPNNFRSTAQVMAANDVNISSPSTVFNALRYVVNFSSTSDFSPYSYLQLSGIPTNFLTRNSSWWFAMKIEQPMKNDSDGQVLFGSNNAFIAYRGNGSYMMTNSTSGYLHTISPNTIVEAGEWIIVKYDDSVGTFGGFSMWINGNKVIDEDTTGGSDMPTTAPTSMWIGSESGATSGPSGYGYPLQTCKISSIMLGTGDLTDAQAGEFTASLYSHVDLATVTPDNVWNFSDTAPVTQLGSINLTPQGSNISFDEL